MKKYLLLILTSCIFHSTFSQNLFKNIATSDGSSDVLSFSDYSSSTSIAKGDSLFFLAKENNQSNYPKLWLTDGTSAGSKRLTDLSDFDQQGDYKILINHKGKIYYTVRESSSYTYLNSTDGNSINKIKNFGTYSSIVSAHILRDTVFFMVQTSFGSSLELWKTDGTNANTTKVTTVANSPYYFDFTNDRGYTVVNNKLIFYLSSNGTGAEPWVSDGTAAGTYILKDITIGTNGSNPQYFTPRGTEVFFLAESNKLWKTDGTTAGTVLAANSLDGTTNYNASSITPFKGELYIKVNSTKLFKTSGSTFTEIKNGLSIYNSGRTVSTNNLMFFVNRNGNEYDLWKSDGTTVGTQKIKTIATSSSYLDIKIQAGLSKCYLLIVKYANDNFDSFGEHWVSDGSVAGTQKINDLNTTFTVGSTSTAIKVIADNYYFTVFDDINGFELWKSNGTNAGTQIVKNINTSIGSSEPQQFIATTNTVFFTANDIKNGRELWKTDGNPNNTQLYADFNNNGGMGGVVSYGSDITSMATLNGVIIAQVANTLMRIDGITPPAQINRMNWVNPPSPELTNYNNKIFYAGWSGSHGRELWTTDGISASLVKDLTVGYADSSPTRFMVSGLFLYFTTNSNTKLWKSDGTEAGTILVKEFFGGSVQSDLVSLNGKIYFRAYDYSNGSELWVSDGTNAGTTVVRDIYPGGGSSSPYNMTALNGYIYFTAYDGSVYSIWKTDGTFANTSAIFTGYSFNLATLKNKLYFIAYDNVSGNQALWETDGIRANNKIVKVFLQNLPSISKFFNIENKYLVFDILPNSSTDELWISDGTGNETKKVKTIRNTSISSASPISEYFYHNKKLYFAADDGINGKELWMWDFGCPDSYTVSDTLRTDTTLISNKFIVGMNAVRSNAKINYNAYNYIDLKQGFDVLKGNIFTTSLVGCGNVPAVAVASSNNQPIYKASDIKNLGEYQPSVWQFLEEPSNNELRAFYFEQKQQGKAAKIAWVIETEADRYSLKLLLEDKQYIGYLPKK
jgi:trimeric autotransporter adhesin